jgi:hypothetical protein
MIVLLITAAVLLITMVLPARLDRGMVDQD